VYLAAVLALAPRPEQPVRAQQLPSVSDLLDRYARKDPSVGQAFAQFQTLDSVRAELDRIAPKFLAAKGADRDGRRRLLVAFALELAQTHAQRESVSASALIEWACRHVRRHEPVDEFDRRWQLAATAVLEGAISPNVLDQHLRHMAGQFPDEPRLALARALVAEQATAPREVLARSRTAPVARRPQDPPPPSMTAFYEEAARRFQALLAIESLRPEANVRRARVHLWVGRYDDAILALRSVEADTTDPALVYLSRLFRGMAYEGLARTDDARREWLSALHVGPGAQSAVMSLAHSLFRERRYSEAEVLVARMLETNDPRADPWWAYWAGDYRFWYKLLTSVREMLP
jgi:tetratricopeptide (TPR) repeat protein